MEQNEIDPYRFSKEVIEYFNMVRSNPKKFASIIREYKQYFKGKVLRVPNSKVGIMTKEGADAFEEAAKYLDSVKAINTVKYNVGLTHVAKEVVDAAFTSAEADRTYLKGVVSRKKQIVPQITEVLSK